MTLSFTSQEVSQAMWNLLRAIQEEIPMKMITRLAATDSPPPDTPLDDIAILEQELVRLLAVRELFMAWVEETTAESRAKITPIQFLRAWSESTGRVVQLLKARRALGGTKEKDALLEVVYDELEARLADPRIWEETGDHTQ